MTTMNENTIQGYRLSPQQRQLWRQQQRATVPLWVRCVVCTPRPLRSELVRRALNALIARHEALRTVFRLLPGMTWPLQVVLDEAPPLVVEVARATSVERALAEWDAQCGAETADGAVVRAVVMTEADGRGVLVLGVTGLCADERSLRNLARELEAAYGRAESADEEGDEVEVAQYVDYAEWQNELLESEEGAAGRAFWEVTLAGAGEPLRLGLGGTGTSSGAVGAQRWELSAEVSRGVEELATALGVGEEAVLLACWQVVLWRSEASWEREVGREVEVWVRCAGRRFAELAGAVGPYARSVPVRVTVGGDYRVEELAGQAWRAVEGAAARQEFYAEGESRGEESVGGTASGRVGYAYEAVGEGQESDGGWEVEEVRVPPSGEGLRLWCERAGGRVRGRVEYAGVADGVQAAGRLAERWVRAVESLVEGGAGELVAKMEVMGEEERRRLLVEFNETAADYPREVCVHELFEAQAARRPEAVAVVSEEEELTYGELNRRANQLAHHLRGMGVGPETLVGLCVERSVGMVVGLLAILKAGGAYVPLDAAYPAERLEFMLEDAGVTVLVTQASVAERLPQTEARVVLLDGVEEAEALARCDGENPRSGVVSENLAYLIYTSGSTGRPKAVMVAHRSVSNLVRALDLAVYASVDGGVRRVSLNATLSFDASVKQWAQLVAGRCVCVIPEGVRADAPAMVDYLRRAGVEALDTTPAQLRLLLAAGLDDEVADDEDGGALRTVLVGGEAIDDALWGALAAARFESFNVYGPTECTVDATVCRVEARPCGTPSLGRAIANARLYVLDAGMGLAPEGVRGELYIGGAGVARGYHGRAGLTAERFVPDPFGVEPGARLYRTGDIVRRLNDGQLEYVGRVDGQVKVRGHRIELGEVEAALRSEAGVREAAAAVRGAESGEQRLVGYVVLSEGGAPVGEIRARLRERLPEYLVPGVIVELEGLPLTRHGKVDRAALPEPEVGRGREYVGPRTGTEELVAGIFGEVLGLAQVGVEENFFDLGGHSLLATQLISRIRKVFDVELPLRNAFEMPTVAALSSEIERARWGEKEAPALPILPVERDAELALSFAQQRLWFIDQLETNKSLYNLSSALALQGRLNLGALAQTLSEITRRHEVFRTTFSNVEGRPVQLISPPTPFSLPLTDLGDLPREEREAEARRLAVEEAQQPFDLSHGPLVRARLLRMGEEEHVVLFTLHHIVSDGWSLNLLIAEVTALYAAYAKGEESPLPELPIQYADYAVWQRDWLQGHVLEEQMCYWREQLSGELPVLKLPTDRPRPPVQSYRGAQHRFSLSPELSEALRELSQREGATLFMVLLAAFKVLLSRYTGQSDIVVGTDIAGRNRAEVEGLIGFFVNQLVMRTDLSGEPTFAETVRRVREVCLGAYAHQDVPFEKIVEELQPERSLGMTPLFQAKMVLQNAPREKLEMGGLELGSLDVNSGMVRFDLLLMLTETPEGITGYVEYGTDMFYQSTIERMVGHFQRLLEGAARNEHERVGNLALMSEAESHQVLVGFNETAREYPRDLCIHELFEQHVAYAPEAVAVISGEERVSYAELNRRANQVAHYLRNLGVGPESLVGLCMERSVDLIVGLLGILKAGGAYVPMDAASPAERLSFMMEDAAISVLLTQTALVERLPVHWGHTVCIDDESTPLKQCGTENPPPAAGADNLAYVIYTSGSTGRPKGVMAPHRGVINLAAWQAENFRLTRESRIAQCFSYSFDGAVGETFMALLNGAALVQLDLRQSSLHQLVEAINEHRLTVGVFVPSLLKQLDPESLTHADGLTVVSVGEVCPVELALRWARRCTFMNAYGPTEYTVYSHLWKATEEALVGAHCVPIGTPIHNTKSLLLDARLNPVPVGVEGEIYLAGAGIVRGYLNRPDMTATSFIANEYVSHDGFRDCGRVSKPSAVADIEKFKEREVATAANGVHPAPLSRKMSPAAALQLVERLAPELVDQTSRFISRCHGDEEVFEGFCRYLLEGANDNYAACGLNREVLNFLLPYERFDGLKGIDFCFGNAEVMRTLSGMGAYMTGLDLNPFFVQKGREMGLNTRMCRADIPTELFADESGVGEGSQDFAITTLALDRIESPRDFLQNVFFVLKEEGRFAIQTLLPIIPVDDGGTESPITYTPEEKRITTGESLEKDKLSLIALLREFGADDVSVCQLPYVVRSRDGVQDYTVWSFMGCKQRAVVAAYRELLGQRLYRTGDLGRYLPDGQIEFLGRRDEQVKVRGFRIELGEIEVVLGAHAGVADCVVVARREGEDTRLVAYVVAAGGGAELVGALRRYVKERLPEHMAPAAYVLLDTLPLTSSGKVDRNALPAPGQAEAQLTTEFIPPRTPTEETLAQLFAEVLSVERVGAHDNFFELGGHSLLATQLISRAQATFGLEVSLRALFQMPTVAEFASLLEQRPTELVGVGDARIERQENKTIDELMAELT